MVAVWPLTTSSAPPATAERKDIFPFSQVPVLASALPSPASPWAAQALVQRAAGDGALDAASVASRIPSAVTVLNATHGIVRIDFAQLDFRQDHPG